MLGLLQCETERESILLTENHLGFLPWFNNDSQRNADQYQQIPTLIVADTQLAHLEFKIGFSWKVGRRSLRRWCRRSLSFCAQNTSLSELCQYSIESYREVVELLFLHPQGDRDIAYYGKQTKTTLTRLANCFGANYFNVSQVFTHK